MKKLPIKNYQTLTSSHSNGHIESTGIPSLLKLSMPSPDLAMMQPKNVDPAMLQQLRGNTTFQLSQLLNYSGTRGYKSAEIPHSCIKWGPLRPSPYYYRGFNSKTFSRVRKPWFSLSSTRRKYLGFNVHVQRVQPYFHRANCRARSGFLLFKFECILISYVWQLFSQRRTALVSETAS